LIREALPRGFTFSRFEISISVDVKFFDESDNLPIRAASAGRRPAGAEFRPGKFVGVELTVAVAIQSQEGACRCCNFLLRKFTVAVCIDDGSQWFQLRWSAWTAAIWPEVIASGSLTRTLAATLRWSWLKWALLKGSVPAGCW